MFCETFLCLLPRGNLWTYFHYFFSSSSLCIFISVCNCLLSLQELHFCNCLFSVNIFGDNVALYQCSSSCSDFNCSKCLCVCALRFRRRFNNFFFIFMCGKMLSICVSVDFFQLSSQFLSGISNSSERVQSFDINNRSFSFVFVFKLTLFCFTFNCSVFLVCLYIFVSVCFHQFI